MREIRREAEDGHTYAVHVPCCFSTVNIATQAIAHMLPRLELWLSEAAWHPISGRMHLRCNRRRDMSRMHLGGLVSN